MFREALILTTAFIAATSNNPAVASDDDGPPPPIPPAPGDDSNSVGSPPLTNTDSLMVSEEEIDFNYGNFSTRRKGCSPTISCTLAGGHCVKSGSDCDGKLDKKGCSGGKKCKCCIPDEHILQDNCTQCPGDYFQIGLQCYKVYNDTALTWFTSQSKCEEKGKEKGYIMAGKPEHDIALRAYIVKEYGMYNS
ncbi:unnamed protein product [Meganyctiphanes norvegica]|uniref:C-type lectin domain-containing protein n=1 Tax=Meganyctiphanes norvegica TaxID=48144 RepID=A0AAV2SEU4_MEGNR